MSRRGRKERKRLAAERREAEPRGALDVGPGFAETVARRLQALARTRWFLPAALAALTVAVWARSFAVPVLGWD